MSLKRKILTGYGVAFALMAIVIAWAVANLVSLGRATDAILRENYRSILAAENMVNALERQDSGVLLMLLGDTEDALPQFQANEGEFLEWLGRAKDNITIEGEAKLVRAIERDYSDYRRQLPLLLDPSGAKVLSSESPSAFYQDSVRGLFTTVRDECIQLRSLNEQTMYAASVKAGRVARRAMWSTLIVAASALVLALIFSLLTADRIVRPLTGFMAAARRISAGDYTVTVPVETADELGHLGREFNQMISHLAHYREMNIDQIIAEKSKGEAILASIADGLIVCDTDMRVTGINPAARRILGAQATVCSGRHCTDLPILRPACESIRCTLETGVQPAIPDEQRIISVADGDTDRHFLFSVTPIPGKERGVSGTVILLRDVTRLKEVERIKSEFVMAASHELRTPLTSLGMSVDLLMDYAAPELSEKNRQLLEAAHEEIHRLKALVSNLLDLSKIEAGRIELQFESITAQSLCDHVQEVFKGQMAMKGIHLTSDLDPGLPRLRADANKITWVLTNLVSNALRYTRPDGSIQIAAKALGGAVHLSVHDDGPGIPPEYQSTVFEKFVQVKGRESGGSGLGLAICKEIVRAHGGTIWVDSGPSEGSTFTFTLPLSH